MALALVVSRMLVLVLAAVLSAGVGCEGVAAGEDPHSTPSSALYGKPEVTQFKDGKCGAITLRFDDSMLSHADVAIPHLNKRGLVGTFYVNPGTDRYKARQEVWDVVCPRVGHELANHTMYHEGAKTYEEADLEIGEASRHIWRLYPEPNKLLPFCTGGGTTWEISDEQMDELWAKYFLFGSWPADYHFPCDDPKSEFRNSGDTDIRPHAQRAIDERSWVVLAFHGIGGEWISCSEETFVELLDFLVEKQDELWVATTGDRWKYREEYQALSVVSLSEAGEAGFTITLDCDDSELRTYGRPLAELYDQPLTVRVPVPDSWAHFTVVQAAGKGAVTKSYEAIEVEGQRVAQFDVRPGVGEARVTRAAPWPAEPFGDAHRGDIWVSPTDGKEMVYVPAGEFVMGSRQGEGDADDDEHPQRRVYLDAFWIDKCEVTVGEYRGFCEATGRTMPQKPRGGESREWEEDHPIVNVSWEEATAYGRWAGKRLPTEAEWEKAARGEDGRKYPWGNAEAADSQCNRSGEGDGYQYTSPVGSFPSGASPYGCLDMAGNVREWCEDWHGSDYYASAPSRNPKGPASGRNRVLRGGSFQNTRLLRCAFRFYNRPTYWNTYSGFRCARDS
jgi:sulfatase modifying factor 1